MVKNAIVIRQLSLVESNDRTKLSALVDNEILWLDFPSFITIEARTEVFIAAVLLEAMYSNLPIKLDDELLVSPLLLSRLEQLQDIYCSWNLDLHKISINGGTKKAPTSKKGSVSFYSGGVDGGYSFCRHQNEISHLITLAGFDVIHAKDQWPNLVTKNALFAKKKGIKLIDINSNIRSFGESRKISIYFLHGLILAGVALMLGFEKTFIPTSLTYDELFPWGSHPITDPLWGIEKREIVHDGADCSRSNKIKFISQFPEVLDNLQVCWGNIDHNCGSCSKCLRTRAALHLLNIHSASIPPLQDFNELKKITISGHSGLPFIKDLMLLAQRSQNKCMAKIFKKIIRQYLLKYHVEELLKILLGSQLKALVYKVRGASWQDYRVKMDRK